MIEPRADRWSAHWDEVEDWHDAIPPRPTRRAPVDEWTTLDWVDTVTLNPRSMQVEVYAYDRCPCGHLYVDHEVGGCTFHVKVAQHRFWSCDCTASDGITRTVSLRRNRP